MKDLFGKYLVWKLLEVCDKSQHVPILQVVRMDWGGDGDCENLLQHAHAWLFLVLEIGVCCQSIIFVKVSEELCASVFCHSGLSNTFVAGGVR